TVMKPMDKMKQKKHRKKLLTFYKTQKNIKKLVRKCRKEFCSSVHQVQGKLYLQKHLQASHRFRSFRFLVLNLSKCSSEREPRVAEIYLHNPSTKSRLLSLLMN